jgi:hypothetical protein
MLTCGLLPPPIAVAFLVEALPTTGNSLTMASTNKIKPINLFIFSLLSYGFVRKKSTLDFGNFATAVPGKPSNCKEMQKTRVLTALSN